MKNFLIRMFCALSLASAAIVHAADTTKQDDSAPSGARSRTIEAQATVTAIDMATRTVTLKTADGQEKTLHVDERARNLGQVKVGDVVRVAYTEALAWKVNKSKKQEPSVETEAGAAAAKPGQKPAGGVARRTTITARIEAIDLDKGTVTLSGPQGNTRTIKARNPDNLKKVKVGDLVDITYTEAVALKVEPAPEKK